MSQRDDERLNDILASVHAIRAHLERGSCPTVPLGAVPDPVGSSLWARVMSGPVPASRAHTRHFRTGPTAPREVVERETVRENGVMDDVDGWPPRERLLCLDCARDFDPAEVREIRLATRVMKVCPKCHGAVRDVPDGLLWPNSD